MKKCTASIFGVRVDNLSKDSILKKIEGFLVSERFHQIATVNPEFLLEARKNERFHNILNRCELTVSDGIGLTIAFWKQGIKMKDRYPGIDLMWDILEQANRNNYKIFLVARKDGLSTWKETATAVKRKYPQLEIGGTNIDIINLNDVISNHESVIGSAIADEVHIAHPDLVFCNFGAPEQEYFLNSLRDAKIDSIRVVMGIGGSFDYITGKVARAPLWMQKSGLEWLYRLIKQPQRIVRIFKAIIIFPIIIIFSQNNDK